MEIFWRCFVPLFVAVDVIGVLPLFVGLTEELDGPRRQRVIVQSIITAAVVALAFLGFGPVVLEFLGITVADFMIAGGILLLAISLSDLLTGEKKQRQADPDSLGAVPIGIPLLAGPAVLTTCILLASLHGRLITGLALLANLALVGLAFFFARPITGFLGRTGSKAFSKVASLLLAAIAVMLIRKGISAFL